MGMFTVANVFGSDSRTSKATDPLPPESGIGANPEALPATGENAPPPSASVPVIRITSGPFETRGETCENNDTPAGIPWKYKNRRVPASDRPASPRLPRPGIAGNELL